MKERIFCIKVEVLREGEWIEAIKFRNRMYAARLWELCQDDDIPCRLTYVPTGIEQEETK